MKKEQRGAYLASFAIGLVIILGLLPLTFYFVLLGIAPTINSAEALKMLEETGSRAVLVDVRPESAYPARRIAGALSLPLTQIRKLDSVNALPPALRDRTLLLVCDSGVLSAQASKYLSAHSVNVYSVRGGMQDWGRAWPQFIDSPYSRFELEGGVLQEPFREMPTGEQAAAAMALLWIKPVYMLLSAAVSLYLILFSKETDLRLLGWAMLVFLVGEVFCAINYVFLADNSYFAEYMHSYSMAVAFGLAAYALMEGLDQRILHFSQAGERCALLPVCGRCVKYQPESCRIRRMSQLLCISLILLAAIPLLAPFRYTAYNTLIGPVIHYYSHPVVHQWFEMRFCPIMAILLSILALIVMQRTSHAAIHPLTKVLLSGAVGFFGFGMFRVTLGMMYAENLMWGVFWEEITELMFVLAVMYVLWIFRRSLLPGTKGIRDMIPWRL